LQDYGAPRDKYGNLVRSRDRQDRPNDDRGNWEGGRDNPKGGFVWGETYGLSQNFLEGLSITPPLVCRVFVANVRKVLVKEALYTLDEFYLWCTEQF